MDRQYQRGVDVRRHGPGSGSLARPRCVRLRVAGRLHLYRTELGEPPGHLPQEWYVCAAAGALSNCVLDAGGDVEARGGTNSVDLRLPSLSDSAHRWNLGPNL